MFVCLHNPTSSIVCASPIRHAFRWQPGRFSLLELCEAVPSFAGDDEPDDLSVNLNPRPSASAPQAGRCRRLDTRIRPQETLPGASIPNSAPF